MLARFGERAPNARKSERYFKAKKDVILWNPIAYQKSIQSVNVFKRSLAYLPTSPVWLALKPEEWKELQGYLYPSWCQARLARDHKLSDLAAILQSKLAPKMTLRGNVTAVECISKPTAPSKRRPWKALTSLAAAGAFLGGLSLSRWTFSLKGNQRK